MPEAARIGDEISHTQAKLGFIVGSVAAAVFEGVAAYGLGCALAGLACAFPFGTIAAIGIGLAVGVLAIGPIGDFIQSTGEAIGRTFTVVTGNLVAIGSADVFVNARPAVRASNNTLDFGACSKHSPLPQKYVIEGAETVFINQWNAARKGDHLDCDATISQGSENVLIGSPSALVGSFSDREISDDMRRYAGYLRMAAGIVGGSLVGATGLRCFLGNVAVGVGVGVGASGVLSNVIPHMEYGANAGNAAGTAIGNWLQGKPVDVASGAKILPDEVDIDLPGAFPLVWSRFYNSRDDRAGIHGRGWSTPQSLELVFREEQLIYLGHQGRENLFPDPAPNESVYNPAEQLKITRSIGGHYFVSYPGDDLIYSFGPRHTQQEGERLRLRRAMDIHDNGIDFHYDADGLLAEMVSSAGHVLTLHYQRIEGAGMRLAEMRLASHADEAADPAAPPGFAHPGQRATGIPLVRYEYSAQGDLVAVIDRTGQVVRRFAWRQHVMVSQQFASGLQSHYEWDRHDPFGRVVRQHGNDGEDLRFEYFDTPLDLALQRPASAVQLAGMAPDGLAPFTVREVRVTDQLGRLQQFVCNRHFLITCFVDPLGATVRDEWDANRRLVRHTDALGNITEFEYDGRAQLTGVRNALGQTAQIKWHEKFARIRAVKHYDGTEWRYDYDALGTLVRIAGPQGYSESVQVDERGLPVRRTDARGGQVRLRYNEQAQLVEYTDCSNRTTRYDYDREGRLRSVADALGQQSDYARDELGRLTALKLPDGATHRYEYDPSGQPVAYIDPLGRPTRYHYNLRGELIEREDAAGGTLELGYDAAFRRTVLINENLRSYRFVYDDADRLVEEQRLDGTRIRIDYDAANRPVAVTHYPSAHGDYFARIEREGEARKLANGGEHGYGLGVIAPEPDTSAPIRTELRRDALGRLVEKRTPAHHTRYRYDGAGRLIEARKLAVTRSESAESGQPPQPPVRPLHTTRFDYDALGNLVAEHATDETSGRTHSLAHEHDLLGNRTQTLLPQIAGARTRRALNYLHYGSGHLHQINLAHLPEPAQGQAHTVEATHRLIADIERDALHREIGRSQGGLATEYALDPLGRRLGSWTHSALADADTYAARLAARAAAAWPAQDGLRKHYQYDTAGELRQRAHSQQGATRYDYDPIGRLLGAERSNGHIAAERFAYDPAGNLLDKLPAKGSTRGYVRDNLVRVFEDKRYDYDGHGRLTEKRAGKHTLQRFEWDDEHRLIAVHTTRASPQARAKRKAAKADGPAQTTQTTTFEYDALGRRVAKVDTFGRTEFIWEGLRLIEERRGSSVVSYVYEAGSYVPLARIDATGEATEQGELGTADDAPAPANEAGHGIKAADAESESASESERANEPEAEAPSNVYYFHTDPVGLPEELTDPQGHIRWRAAYQAWGNTLAERWETIDLKGETVAFAEDDGRPAIEQNLRYQGQYLDRDTGLHYNTFRYYDPDLGRFISPDPIGLGGGTNLHGHAPNANRWIDPLGWDWNYYLTDSNGNIYYHGRAADSQTMGDVMYRHGKNVGNDGLPRMGPGDTINRTTPVGTSKDVVRGIENSGTRTDGVLGRGSDSVRGNIDQGISDRKLATTAGETRVAAGQRHLANNGAASARDLAPLESKTMQSRPARGGC